MSSSGKYYNNGRKAEFIETYISELGQDCPSTTLRLIKNDLKSIFTASAEVESEFDQDLSQFKFYEQYKKVVKNLPCIERSLISCINLYRIYVKWCLDSNYIRLQDYKMNPFLKKSNWAEIISLINIDEYTYVKNAEYLHELLENSLNDDEEMTAHTKVKCLYYALYMGIDFKLINKAKMENINLNKMTFLGVSIPKEFQKTFRVYSEMKGEYRKNEHAKFFCKYIDKENFLRVTTKNVNDASSRSVVYVSKYLTKFNSKLINPFEPECKYKLSKSTLGRSKIFDELHTHILNNPGSNIYECLKEFSKIYPSFFSKNHQFNYIQYLIYLRLFYPDELKLEIQQR